MKSIPPTRLVCSLVIYFAIVFPGGAMLAPWLYWLAHWAGHWRPLSGLADAPFNRCLDRALLGLALICLWPLLRYSGLQSWRELGFIRQDRAATQIFKGFALGWASLAAVALLALVCGANAFVSTHSAVDWFHLLVSATLTAVIVAVLEEFIFRGALFGLLRRGLSWPAALIVSSAVYSAVHFIKKAESAPVVEWYSGFSLLWAMLSHPPAMMPAFLTLLVAGSILALAYQRTGALYFSIGLHAGWIFWLKSYHFLFRTSGVHPSFWGTDTLIDGWLSFLVLAVIFLVAWRRNVLWLPSGGRKSVEP
jgi:membrane protease YdiL (CAAX protease family)